MKRRRIFSVKDSNGKRGRKEVSRTEIQCSGSLFSDLPRDILVNILLRLPVKMIFIFKCVCITSHDIVSDPEFAKLHFDQSDVYPLIIRTNSYNRYKSKMVHLVRPTFPNKPGCVSNVLRFEIPEKSRLPKYHDGYDVVTCNGLLCLFKPFCGEQYFPIVCNPVTGEYINLPRSKKIDSHGHSMHYGFGFSPVTNQYKVIRMYEKGIRLSTRVSISNKVEVHILGTKAWKDIGFFSQSIPNLSPTYFNGFLYWFSKDSRPLSILTFDLEKERFGSVSAPAHFGGFLYDSVSLGVLGGELCISGAFKSGTIHVWAMKDYGTNEKVFPKVFSFDHLLYSYPIWHKGPFQPIKYLNDGALLVFYSLERALVYVDPKENRFRYLKVREFDKRLSGFEAIAYTPSFVSLKHALPGKNVKVLNVNSRCAKSMLHKEGDNIDIIEKEFHSVPGCGYYCNSDDDI